MLCYREMLHLTKYALVYKVVTVYKSPVFFLFMVTRLLQSFLCFTPWRVINNNDYGLINMLKHIQYIYDQFQNVFFYN